MTMLFAMGTCSLHAAETDTFDAVFDEMQKLARTPEQKVETAQAFLAKIKELPDSREILCQRAIRLAMDARTDEAVGIVNAAYSICHEAQLGDKEELLRSWIKDVNSMARWRIETGEKTRSVHKVFDLYENLFELLIEDGRYRDASKALSEQRAYTRHNGRSFSDARAILKTLGQREYALRDRIREEDKLASLLEEAAGGGSPATKAGILLFSQDRLSKALPLLERGDEEAKPYIQIARKILPFDTKITPTGLQQDMIDTFAKALQGGEPLGRAAQDLAREPALKEEAMRLASMEAVNKPLGDLPKQLLSKARSVLDKNAIEPKPEDLLQAANGYEGLAKQDSQYGTDRMEKASRFFLWKSIQLHEAYVGARIDSGSEDVAMAGLKKELLAKELELAGGYEPDAAFSGSDDIARKGRLATVKVEWHNTEIADGAKAYTNYNYFLVDVPKGLAGLSMIQQIKRREVSVEFEVTRAGTVHCIHRSMPGEGWKELNSKIGINYNGGVSRLNIYAKFLPEGSYSLPKGAWLIYSKK